MTTTHTLGWRLHGLSVTGYRHKVDGIPCQDACGHRSRAQDDVFVLAVADGAGSRPRAKEGAELAIALVRERFAAAPVGRIPVHDVRYYLQEEFEKVRRAFVQETGIHRNDYATTLTVVVHTPDWLGYLSVGDGFAVLRSGIESERPQFHLLPQPLPVSEYGNEAFFVTSDDVGERLVTGCVVDQGVTGIMLSTDGLTQAALLSPGNVNKRPNDAFVSKVLGALERDGIAPEDEERELAALLASSRLARANADDKTVLRAVRS